jgi:hypothetical protein
MFTLVRAIVYAMLFMGFVLVVIPMRVVVPAVHAQSAHFTKRVD